MSDHLPSHDSLPQSLTEFSPSQDSLDPKDEPETSQQSLTKPGFKKRALNHQNSEVISDIEKNGATWVQDISEPIIFKENTQSELIVSGSPEKMSFSGMGYQSPEFSSLQTLKCIINEAKQAERYMLTGEDHNYDVDNYMKVNFSEDSKGREYFANDDIRFDIMPTNIIKTGNQGLVIDFTGEATEGENERFETKASTNDALTHSKSSYITGPVRYSKMPEEEAANIFEQRRKELLDNLTKKGKRKNLRIFQDIDANTAKPSDAQIGSPKEKSSGPGFVIMNTRKPSLNQLRGAESPASNKQDKIRDSTLRKSLNPTKNNKLPIGPTSYGRDKRDLGSPVSVGKDNNLKVKALEAKERKEPASAPIAKSAVKEAKSFKKEEMSPNKICVDAKTLKQGINKSTRNTAKDINVTEGRRETLSKQHSEVVPEVKSAELLSARQLVPGKNKEIWADIEKLDQQIQQLEDVKSVGYQKDQIIVTTPQGDNKGLFKRRSKEKAGGDIGIEHLQARNESPNIPRSSDRYKLDSDDLLIENEADNVYKRFLNDRLQGESAVIGYRKSPTSTSDESSTNLYGQSQRSQGERKMSNRSEYLYQKAIEQKEARQYQIEKRQKEKEVAELEGCTFTPSLQGKPLETLEDFETRAKNWQQHKEKKLHDIEKDTIEREMAECTFYPHTAVKKEDAGKFNPEDVYQRNMEWKRKIEAEGVEKKNELMRMLTSPNENKLQSHSSMYSSRMSHSNGPYISKSPDKKGEPLGSSKSSSKILHVGNKRLNETEVKVFNLTTDLNRSKLRSTETQSSHFNTIEDEFSSRRRSDQLKRPNPEAYASADLKEILKRGISYRSDKNEGFKPKGTTSPTKTSKEFSSNPTKAKDNQPNHPVVLTTLRDSFPSKKSPVGLNGTPLGFTDNSSKVMKNSSDVTPATNKYYLSRKPKHPMDSNVTTHSNTPTLDKKDVASPVGYGNQIKKHPSKALAPAAYQIQQSSKIDQENKNLKRNLGAKGQEVISVPVELSEDQLFYYPEEDRIPLATRQSNQHEQLMGPGNSRRNTAKDIASGVEKNFIEFINLTSKGKQPSDKSGPTSPQMESSQSKKRRNNLSLQ